MNVGLLDGGGYVVNVIVLADDRPVPETWGGLATYAQPCAIGGRVVDGVYTPPVDDTPPAPVPATITLRQLVLGLLSYGETADAQALAARTVPPGLEPVVESLPADQQLVVALTIQTMTEADRADPLIDLAAAAYGWDATAADDFFRAATLL
jgi:hypothetical protein